MRTSAASSRLGLPITRASTFSVFADKISLVVRVRNNRQTDNVGCVGKRSVTAPVLLDGLREFPHRIRGRTSAAFVDAGEDFVQTDPVAILGPDGWNPPFFGKG